MINYSQKFLWWSLSLSLHSHFLWLYQPLISAGCGQKASAFLSCYAGNIIITTLPPIKTEGLCKSDVEDLMNRTRAMMLEAFTITSKEVQSAALMKTPSY